MATQGPTSLPAFFNTDTDFRNWVAGIDAAIQALGIVNTTDTGQIDATTVVKPAAVNTAQGYKIYRFADSLQATFPVFIKLEFGSGGAVDRPSLWVTVGTTTNGAGTIGGQVTTRKQLPAGSKSAGATLPLYLAGDTGRISGIVNLDNASNQFGLFMHIERALDSSGNPTADGVVVLYSGGSQSAYFQVIPPTGALPTASSNTPFPSPLGMQTKAGTDSYLDLLTVAAKGFARGVKLCLYVHADIGELATITADIFGATRTFMPLGDGTPTGVIPSSPTCGLALLWE
jgi:hypothetical protein